jgi:ribosomal protein L10
MPLSPEKKAWYFDKLKSCFGKYNKCFLVSVDNVGSNLMQRIRIQLRGKAEILMGKNTMIRKIIKEYVEENPDTVFGAMLDKIGGNTGFVFTDGDLGEIRDIVFTVESTHRAAGGHVQLSIRHAARHASATQNQITSPASFFLLLLLLPHPLYL